MKRFLTFILAAILVLAFGATSLAGAVNYSLFTKLLSAHVKDGVVDYAGFKQDEGMLDRYLDQLATVVPSALDRAGQMAFYINLYNAWTIKLILTGYPGVASIKDLGGFFSSPWKKEIVRVDGKVLTLDNIEHDILRPTFKDPRVHFAVNCASKGCPPLRSEAFRAEDLDRQLDEQTKIFINDPARTYLEGNTLHVTRIMKWFGDDFDNDPAAFVKKYANDDFRARLEKVGKALKVDFLDYDWSLNGK